ncbi:MAG: two-component system phosphate regulon response regulator PhoB [Polaribacter sp.]|jgi:two-component system phosphate regulon response regulator PhoB
MPAKILLVEDEEPIREMLRYALEKDGYEVIEVANAMMARESLMTERPNLAIVDWMMPEESGVEFIKRLKQDEIWANLPVIMLTARVEEMDKVKGLENGADDYMTKPVAIKELLARIKALLRRASPNQLNETIESLGITLNMATRQCYIDNQLCSIAGAEFNLLNFFLMHKNKVYSRSQLLDFVWGQGVYLEERTIDVHMLRLRKILKPSSKDKYFITVRGMGYMFTDTE